MKRRPRSVAVQLLLGLDVAAAPEPTREAPPAPVTFTEMLGFGPSAPAPAPVAAWDGYPGEFAHGGAAPWETTLCGLPAGRGDQIELCSSLSAVTCPACLANPPRPFRRPAETCSACGCTDDNPCRDAAGKVACSWMRRGDPRCSRCIVAAERPVAPSHDPLDPWGLAPPGVDVDDLSTVQHPTAYELRTPAPWEA